MIEMRVQKKKGKNEKRSGTGYIDYYYALINVSFNNQVNSVHLDRWWKNPASSMMRGQRDNRYDDTQQSKKKIFYDKKQN